MKKILFAIVWLIYTAFLFASEKESNLLVIDNGKSDYCILITSKTDEKEVLASEILQKYIEKISGAVLPIYSEEDNVNKYPAFILRTTLELDNSKLKKKLGEDGFFIQTSDNNLYITGGTGLGLVYGVTSFLEDYLGVRYLAPYVEYVPKQKSIDLGIINDLQVPPATIRIVNGNFTDDILYKYFRKLNTIADRWRDPTLRGYYVHTFRWLVPAEKYFDTNPEYFAYVNGKRVAHGQLCLSNPDVQKIIIENLKAEVEPHPDIKYWSVSQNDNYYYCQCENCRKIDSIEGSPSGIMLRLVNAVARELKDKTITTLAYQYTRKPPLITVPDSNVMVTLCSIELNRTHPIPEDTAAEVIAFRSDMEGWGKICNNIMMWDYEVQFSNYLTPFPLFHTLKPNLQYFTENNVVANFQQCNARHGVELAELKSYLMSELLWNPNANDDEIINDFMKHYYGKAAKWIRKYFDLLHSECQQYNQYLDIYGNPVQAANTYLSAENLEKYRLYFDSAEYAVKDDSALYARVRIARVPIIFSELEIAKSDLFGERGWYEKIGGKYILKDNMMNLLETFCQICRKYDIVYLNESGLRIFDTWYDNTMRAISMDMEGNLAFQKKVIFHTDLDPRYSANGDATLTNGVKGSEDYKQNWLGWEAQDVEFTLDLGKVKKINSVEVNTLQFLKSWITHPLSISCSISSDNKKFKKTQILHSNENLKEEPMMKIFSFNFKNEKARYIKFYVKATKALPEWHDYSGMKSWVFIDEVSVR